MRRLGVWQPSNVKTANALLNALHGDARKTYQRYSSLLVLLTWHSDLASHHEVICVGDILSAIWTLRHVTVL